MKLLRPNRPGLRSCAAALVILLSTAPWAHAAAQQGKGAAGGFDMSSDKPVHIEADVLEVMDDQGQAVFTGNVVAKQGPTTLQTTKLTVYYAGGAIAKQTGTDKDAGQQQPAAADGKPGAPGDRIKRLEAEGQVVVTTRDQQATGEKAVFEMADNTVTLTGNVVLTQGKNVLRGTELTVDLDTGHSKLVSNDGTGQPGRVSGMFLPGAAKQAGKKAGQ